MDDQSQSKIDNNQIKDSNKSAHSLLLPHEIKQKLDDYVVGQDLTKKVLSVAVYNHYKRLLIHQNNNIEIEKSNILLVGPTGCGKTLLAKTLAHILDVPYAIADATTVTEAGYVGEDVENILLQLVQAADFDIKLAEKGIIYIDEIDKIGRRTENVSLTRDVSGEGVQQALLKIIEGTIAKIPPKGGRKHPQQEYLQIDTSNILFICGGAFVGISDLIEQRTKDTSIGFGLSQDKSENITQNIESEDLLRFGLIPEFIGRLPITSMLNELNVEELVHILIKPKNAIFKQYQILLGLDGVILEYEENALHRLAELAINHKTGARGLKTMIEKLMLDIMYEIPQNKKIKSFKITCELIDSEFNILSKDIKKKSA